MSLFPQTSAQPATSSLYTSGDGAPKPSQASTSLFSSGNTSSGSGFGSSSSAAPSSSQSGSMDEGKLRAMVALNTSFLNWLESKVKASPETSLVSGVRMYLEHVGSVLGPDGAQEHASGSSGSSMDVEKAKAPSSIGNAAELGKGNGSKPSGTAPKPSFIFGSSSGVSTAPSLFGSGNGASAAPSLFGGPASAPPSGASLFSAPSGASSLFGGSSGSAPTSLFTPNFSGGLFGNTGAASGSAKNEDDGEDGGDDDGDAEPAEPTIQAQKSKDEEEDVLFELEPCKIMVLKDKEWLSRGGKGRLVLTKHRQSGKCRAVLRAGTTGNLYFNAPINNSMLSSLSRQKNSVRLITTSFTVEEGQVKADNDGKPTLYAVKTLTEDDAERLRAALESAMKTS
jgi:hypothetical protein